MTCSTFLHSLHHAPRQSSLLKRNRTGTKLTRKPIPEFVVGRYRNSVQGFKELWPWQVFLYLLLLLME
ncbi:hypothetical protein P8452_35037 [Trifolium repens]|nr:hypothetical protein P8452_35037 [Trifolium repens]